jgi:diaminohydroxyphosphoribosylaminopyrimidine deaminase/5-amino-6-(5-phosphoribosylamino)uracil reductase
MVVRRVISADEKFMHELCRRVDLSLVRPTPNPKVGCLIIKDGKEIGFGVHAIAGGPHAEVIAGEIAGEEIAGSTVYVTLEPCSHFGKTPPCVDFLIENNVARVVYAIADPTSASGGAEKLRAAGIETLGGVGIEVATQTLAPWFYFARNKIPFVRLKYAVTKDGFIAREDGSSKWISNEESREVVHKLRAQSDAVLVGTNTARIDEPKLDARIDGVGKQPVAYVMGLSEISAFVPNAKILKTQDPELALATMAADGVQSVLLEGGKVLADAFLAAGKVCEIWVFKGEAEFGSGVAAPHFSNSEWKVQNQQRIGEDELTVYVPA